MIEQAELAERLEQLLQSVLHASDNTERLRAQRAMEGELWDNKAGIIRALQALAAKDAEIARLIEDRARFPDKPDGIGRMIEAHIGNLKKGKEEADRHAVDAMKTLFRIVREEVDLERERCASIAIAIDSGRGNEKEIAAAIRTPVALNVQEG